MRPTINVRCCCTPGLVLGRLPAPVHGNRVRYLEPMSMPAADPFLQDAVSPLAPGRAFQFEKQTAFGHDGGFRWRERALNSNHSLVDDLLKLHDFELICDIPERIWVGKNPSRDRLLDADDELQKRVGK